MIEQTELTLNTFRKDLIKRLSDEARKDLGLTPSEMEEIIDLMSKDLKDNLNARAVEVWLNSFARKYTIPILTPQTLEEARKFLGLDRDQLAEVTGYGGKDGRHRQIYRLERGKVSINATFSCLVRAYLSGYRPPRWPVNTKLEP